MYYYLKALHIIFIVTWFAGMFYIVRLFIYNTEAGEKSEPERSILRNQLGLMSRRLWYGITWPSAILTLVFGPFVMVHPSFQWYKLLSLPVGKWLLIKLVLVVILYIYHFSLHRLYIQQSRGVFRYSSQKLRLWNEVATILLVAIVMLASVKQSVSFVWGIAGLVVFILILLAAIRIYRIIRER